LNATRVSTILCLGIAALLLPRLAVASGKPGCVAVTTMPTPSGLLPILMLDFNNPGDTVTFTGAQLDTAGGLELTVAPSGGIVPTFTQLLFTTDYTPGFIIEPELGILGYLFPVKWTTTVTPDGVLLDWQPGAPQLGQTFSDINGESQIAALQLEIDPTASDAPNFSAFDSAHFSVQATPEPGLMTLTGGLLVSGGLLLRHTRRRKR
jgi:hypothetical protein